MKKIVSIILIVVMMVVPCNITSASDEQYDVIKVEYSDNNENLESMQILQKDNQIYANAEELGKRLGYEVSVKEDYVSIYNNQFCENVPFALTIFYYDSTKVSHMLFNKLVNSYEAPCKTIKNEKGVWIPLEYSLLLLNSGLLILNNTIMIDMPSKNTLDIFMDILKDNEKILFSWDKDIGISDDNIDAMGKAAMVVSVFNGVLNKDGVSWAQLIQGYALDSYPYDEEYGKRLAMLFSTYSNEELIQETNKIKSVMSNFNGKGTLGKAISEVSTGLDNNIEELLRESNQLKDQITADNNASIVAYNKSYQALAMACDEADLFSDATELYEKVGKGVSDATSMLDKMYKVAQVIGYATEFKNQDEFAVEALTTFINESETQSTMSKSMREGISNYTGTLKTDIATYSAMRFLEENYDDYIFDAMNFSSTLGMEGNIMLLAWDVASNNIPFYKEGLNNTDNFMLSLYASIFQAEAFREYQKERDLLFGDESNITSEKLENVSELCYTYLKSCYITRETALGSLTEETKENIASTVKKEKSINEEIAKYLVRLKDAEETNINKEYGFLPADNKEYLATTKKSNLCEILQKKNAPVVDVKLEIKYEGTEEYAVINGVSESGENVWTKITEKEPVAELEGIYSIGVLNEKFIYVDAGTIVALALEDGVEIWKNSDFEGSGCYVVDEAGRIYMSGYYGPDFFAINENGETLCKIEKLDINCYYPFQIEIVDGKVLLTYEEDGAGSNAAYQIDMTTFEYERVQEDIVLSNDELCSLAGQYYEKISGTPAPENIVVDSEDGNQVTIWLYQDFGDHIATIDWYFIDRTTGKGTNTMGNQIDLLKQ